jgi:YidC/Oxa1 family membrane protein insertase
VQVPVFIGLFHVLRTFGPVNAAGVPVNDNGSIRTENYFFDQEGVLSFNRASLFGAKLGEWVTKGEAQLNAAGTSIANMLIVMIPLMIAAGIFTHITARHSVARQTAAQGENPQTAIMNKLMLYVFPIGVVVGAPFLPLAVLLYWVSNNLWTLGQQWVVYRRIDVEETEKRETATAAQKSLAPKPGQKPIRPEQQRDAEPAPKTPGPRTARPPAAARPAPTGRARRPPTPSAAVAASSASAADPTNHIGRPRTADVSASGSPAATRSKSRGDERGEDRRAAGWRDRVQRRGPARPRR